MHRHVDIRRVGLQALANDQASLAVRVLARTDEGDVGSQSYVAAHLLPGEMKVVVSKPHVCSAAGDRIDTARRIIGCRPGVRDRADICLVREQTLFTFRLLSRCLASERPGPRSGMPGKGRRGARHHRGTNSERRISHVSFS